MSHPHLRPGSFSALIKGITELAKEIKCDFMDSSADSGIYVDRTINLDQLTLFLSSKQWKKADIETQVLMDKVSCVDLVDDADIHNYIFYYDTCASKKSDNLLKKIDQLWMEYSNNHFGFSVQAEIYRKSVREEELRNFSWTGRFEEGWQLFKKRVGWVKPDGNTDVLYGNLTFNINAPRGHLPASLYYGLFSYRQKTWEGYKRVYLELDNRCVGRYDSFYRWLEINSTCGRLISDKEYR